MQISHITDKICKESDIFEQRLPLDNADILELGCGKAEITRLIASNGTNRRVIATEVDQIQHQQNLLIDDLPNVRFIKAGSENIPLDDSSIDIIFMFKSFHHVPLERMSDALNESKRVLKPGGMLYISEPIFDGNFNEVLRLFHDEKAIRKAAFESIKKAVHKKEFLLVEQIFFNTAVTFENFEDFENKVINVTHSQHRLSPDLYKKVKAEFLQNMTDNGANFLIPIRVDLLQRPI